MWITDSGTLSRGQCSENFQYFVFVAEPYESICEEKVLVFTTLLSNCLLLLWSEKESILLRFDLLENIIHEEDLVYKSWCTTNVWQC